MKLFNMGLPNGFKLSERPDMTGCGGGRTDSHIKIPTPAEKVLRQASEANFRNLIQRPVTRFQ